MRGRRVRKVITVTACVLAALGTGLPAATGSVAPGSARVARPAAPTTALPTAAVGTWRVDARLPLDRAVPPQEYSNGYTFLDVEAVGPQDAWAVGARGYNIGSWGSPVLRHWHDGQWLTPAVPRWMNGSVGGWVNQLEAVGGSSPDDVWAFGEYDLVTETVLRAVHWNGTTWTKATVPFQSAFAPEITSVLSFGSSQAWAFGCYCEASQLPYIAEFTGGKWHDVTPRGLPSAGIWTASAISPSDIWAVTGDSNIGSFGALRWNGVNWVRVAVPSSLSLGSQAFSPGGGLVATKTNGVWFAGSLEATGAAAVVHEMNGKWTVTLPAAGSGLAPLVSDGEGGLWSASQALGTNISAQLWHYSGGQWSQSADPPGISSPYRITWMAHVPGSQTTLAIGNDQKNELLLSTP